VMPRGNTRSGRDSFRFEQKRKKSPPHLNSTFEEMPRETTRSGRESGNYMRERRYSPDSSSREMPRGSTGSEFMQERRDSSPPSNSSYGEKLSTLTMTYSEYKALKAAKGKDKK